MPVVYVAAVRVSYCLHTMTPPVRICRPHLLLAAALVWGLAVGAVSLHAQSPGGAPLVPAISHDAAGEEIYAAACVTCHAPDGKGSPRSVVGFDTPLPDFTDCAFATAEADVDWQTVVHEGGPIRGLSRRMPAFGDALTEDQIAAVVGYVRGFCAEPAWPRGDLNFPRAFFTEKAFPENETVWTSGFTRGAERAVTNQLVYERRWGARSQFEAVIPLDFQRAATGEWTRGLGDIALAWRRTMLSSLRTGTIAAAGLEVAFPTGHAETGLGNGYRIYEPFAMLGQALPRNSFLQLHGGYEVPSNRVDATREAYFRTAVGTTLAQDRGFGRTWSPQVELLWARPSGGESEWDVVPQVQVSLSKIQHVLVAAGLRVPLTERQVRRPQFVTYLLWDWFDGGFLEFWK